MESTELSIADSLMSSLVTHLGTTGFLKGIDIFGFSGKSGHCKRYDVALGLLSVSLSVMVTDGTLDTKIVLQV